MKELPPNSPQRGLPHPRGCLAWSLLYFSDLWISLRPAGGDDRGVFHFVYKGQQPPDVVAGEQRLISETADAGAVTFIINYTNGIYTLYVNSSRVPGEIHIPFPLAGGAIRTFSRGQPGTITTLSAGLSAEPFTEAQIHALSTLDADWEMYPQMTLLVPRIADSEGAQSCQGTLGGGIISPNEYREFINRPRPSAAIYVDQNHRHASDENDGFDVSLPMKTITAAVEKARPNTTVWVRKGVYPESVSIRYSGIGVHSPVTISGWPGEEDEVVLTGADRVAGWEPYGENIWRKENWPLQWSDWGAGHPGWESGEPPFDPVKRWRRSWHEHLFLEGQELMHMESYAVLIPMSFTVDK